ncbi:hypothetical protein P152DRAFT_399204 [Eremomyces bilateralis CBS 781.70]|uniref:Uncharacterized protein n=1 Tax=Eremomyces bilateralis CBS 781.70 TaxID=1392243 RepID=A0A6G1G085_9PEZI|nr:uncharacterized protein P152DRAFT_399204 [Eremomyces bilateralis CBS 781.70]KAF1811453.1 hypothetical protein P152DRAFT_399204 [Eremomyces bilateralis CBS 781.70]
MYGGAAAGNVGLAGTPGGNTTSPYGDAGETSGFGQPRNAAIEVLSNQFGGMQNYYDTGSASAQGGAAAGATGANTAFPNLYGAGQGHSRQDSMSYPAEQAGFPAAGAGAVGYTGAQSSQGIGPDLDNAYGQYQAELRRTFECVRDGRLVEAGQSLVQISDWLLGNAESLGLVRDDETIHDERLKLWSEFNSCWLATLQRQKDLTIEVSRNPDILRPPISLLEHDYMETMGKELVRLCDAVEKHGLVDYQLGVWEEDIVELLTQCLDLLEAQQSGTGQGQPTAPTSRRR